MYPSTQFIIVLLMLCMCMGCVESQDRMNESILLEKASGDGTKSDVCLNLDKVDEINNRKNKTAQDTTETEEYAVYDRLLGSGNANRSLVVIYENATTGCPHCSAALFYGFNRSSLLEEMPSLDLKAFEDFEAKNNCTYQLKNLFRYSGKYAIVNDSELFEIFLVDQSKNYWDDWEDYYLKKCPHSPGIRISHGLDSIPIWTRLWSKMESIFHICSQAVANWFCLKREMEVGMSPIISAFGSLNLFFRNTAGIISSSQELLQPLHLAGGHGPLSLDYLHHQIGHLLGAQSSGVDLVHPLAILNGLH